MQNEKKLKVYQEAMNLTENIYLVEYPKTETYGLQSQIRRASASIALLISEGCGRKTANDFNHFLIQARGSAKEVATALELSKRLKYIDFSSYNKLSEHANKVGAMLTSLINKVDGGNRNAKQSKTKNDKPSTTNECG